MRKFTLTPNGNYYLDAGDYQISYRPSDDNDPWRGTSLAAPEGGETALIVNRKYYILNGDWRNAYLHCDSLEACKALFAQEEAEHRSGFSDPL